jgi:aryl-alcohol dehydrogenase-like predicted oxidoreductase
VLGKVHDYRKTRSLHMQMRTLGGSGLQVAPLAFGGNVFGWTADEATSFALLDAFVGAGFNLVDTADVYSVWAPGHTGGEWSGDRPLDEGARQPRAHACWPPRWA